MKKFTENIFKYRSYTPIPFLLVMVIFQKATWQSLVGGFVIVAIGELFRFWGVVYAGSETRTTGTVGGTYLVTRGAFSHLRNPLYLGNILIYVGIGIMSWSVFPYLQIVALIFFLFQYDTIIKGEEEYLRKAFGKEYEEYTRNVPRLIPRLTSYKDGNSKQPELNYKAGFRSEKRTLQAIVIVTLILLLLFILV